jgi:dienelactone hydrolase
VLLAPHVHGEIVPPLTGSPRAAVVVLSGSSGRLEHERAELLSRHGALALALTYFGDDGQPPGICEVPVETFTKAVDLLCDKAPDARIGMIGVSKGAEAALVTSVVDPRVQTVVAIAPTPVVWANVGPGRDGESYPYRSSWTWQGEPLPFVSYDETWEPGPAPVANVELYRRSLVLDPERTRRATIDVTAARADLLLVAGGDDRMWDGLAHARAIEATRRAAGCQVEVVSTPDAGHRVLLPGETPVPPSARYAHGGSPDADRALGELAWPRVRAVLGLA